MTRDAIVIVSLSLVILGVLASIGVLAWQEALREKEIQEHYADETFLNDGGK